MSYEPDIDTHQSAIDEMADLFAAEELVSALVEFSLLAIDESPAGFPDCTIGEMRDAVETLRKWNAQPPHAGFCLGHYLLPDDEFIEACYTNFMAGDVCPPLTIARDRESGRLYITFKK